MLTSNFCDNLSEIPNDPGQMYKSGFRYLKT